MDTIGLADYEPKFAALGFYSMDTVKNELQKIDLLGFDIPDEDIETIWNSVNTLRNGDGQASSQSNLDDKPSAEAASGSKKKKEVAFGPIEVDAKSFHEVLVHYNCAPESRNPSGRFFNFFFLLLNIRRLILHL